MQVILSQDHHLHVRALGEGSPTVLLLHGWAVSGRIWDPFVEHWPLEAGRLLIPDLRGTGWSAKPHKGYSLDDYTSDVVKLIDEFHLNDIVLVGHSMGGTIAMRVALERPQSLLKLVLVSPVPPTGIPLLEPDIAFFRSLGGHRQGAEQMLGMMMARRPAGAIFERLVDETSNVAIEAFLGGLDAWRTASFAERVGAISTPTVVMGGEEEQPLAPAFLQAQVVARIPGATFVMVPGVGHYPHVEAPADFAALLYHNMP
jgi:pimeloyl-ACP methyl ester carboxylesterase